MTSGSVQYFLDLLILSALALPIYHTSRSIRLRQCISIGVGLWMLYTVAPRLLLYWPVFWMMVWCMVVHLPKVRDPRSKTMLFAGCLLAVMFPMVEWKLYPGWFERIVNETLAGSLAFLIPPLARTDSFVPWLVPLGLSFSTFRAADLLVCVQLDLVKKPKLREILHYGLFPPVLLVGPVIQFQEVTVQNTPERDLPRHLANGLGRVLVGFFKLFVLARPLSGSLATITQFPQEPHLSQTDLALQVFVFAWYLYINFSAYSDLAIGISRLYGFSVRENFNYPFFRPSLQKFWANWHMSLTSFAQRNVFIPFGGYRANTQYVATLLTMMTIALWHNLNVPMVVFGLCHSAVLILLRVKTYRTATTTPPSTAYLVLGATATFLFVAATLPLLMLKAGDIVPFYGLLFFGWRP